MFGYASEELQQLSFLDICIDGGGRRMSRSLYTNCARACVFSMRSTKHNTVAKDGTTLPVNTYFSAVGERPARSARNVSYGDRRYFGTPGGRRCVAAAALNQSWGGIARLTTVGAMAATIVHELNQPLAAIVSNGNAGLRWLDRPEPRSRRGPVGIRAHLSTRVIALPRSGHKHSGNVQKGFGREIAGGRRYNRTRLRCCFRLALGS